MKINLGHIALGLFICMNSAFDLINIPKSTNLTILYFSLMYNTLLIWTIREYLLSLNKPLKWTKALLSGDRYFLAMGVGLLVRIIWELTKLGMGYDAYMKSVNNYQKSLLIIFFTIALLLIVVQNGRNKTNNRNSDK
jgi:hypothetical protein